MCGGDPAEQGNMIDIFFRAEAVKGIKFGERYFSLSRVIFNFFR